MRRRHGDAWFRRRSVVGLVAVVAALAPSAAGAGVADVAPGYGNGGSASIESCPYPEVAAAPAGGIVVSCAGVLRRLDDAGNRDDAWASGGTADIGEEIALASTAHRTLVLARVSRTTVTALGPRGRRDPAFGTEGSTELPPGELAEQYPIVNSWRRIVAATDGSVLVAGNRRQGRAVGEVVVVRLDPDGRIDTAFGTDGLATLDRSLTPLVLVPDPVHPGSVYGISDHFLYRLLPDGSLDPTFGSDGVVAAPTVGDGGELFLLAVATTASGLLVAGTAQKQAEDEDGAYVAAFDVDGGAAPWAGSLAPTLIDQGVHQFPVSLAVAPSGEVAVAVARRSGTSSHQPAAHFRTADGEATGSVWTGQIRGGMRGGPLALLDAHGRLLVVAGPVQAAGATHVTALEWTEPNPAAAGEGTTVLRSANGSEAARFRFGRPGDRVVACDWDGDGTDSVSVVRPDRDNPIWLLTDRNAGGVASKTFAYGTAGDLPLCGDWDGDGRDSPGVYRAATAEFLLRDARSSGSADHAFRFGSPALGDRPLAGDWDGDGIDEIGVWRHRASTFHLRLVDHQGGPADAEFRFGSPSSGDRPVVGDWDGDGDDEVGVRRPGSSTFHLRDQLAGGASDRSIPWGLAPDTPLGGDWDGSGADDIGVDRR